jgi:sigma-B regulation protein RsbU (phosphoserine phosphatase)
LARPARKRDPLDKKLLELTALFDICRSLTSSLSLRSILENALRIPMGQLLIGKGIVLLKNPSSSEFTVEGLKGLPRDLLHKSLTVHTPPQHLLMIDAAGDEDGWMAFFREFGLGILLPLTSSRGTIGLMGFGPKINRKTFDEGEIEFLDSLSNIAATAVVNGMMVDEIQSVNRILDRKVQQLNTLFDISRELNTTLDREKIASLLAFAVMGELLVNRCAVLVRESGGMEVLVEKGSPFPVPIDRELDQIREAVFLNDTDRFESCRRAGLAILVPMRIQNEVKGLLAIGTKISGGTCSDAEIDFLQTLGNQAMSVLENARLFEEELEKRRLEEELNLAQKIQQDLLPKDIPTIMGFDIAAVNIPSRQVGGDYFDIIPLPENRMGLAIADVSGKGAGAALLMANLQASLRALVQNNQSIPDMLFRLNNLIHKNTALDRFITFFYGELDIRNRTFVFCNAGHNPPYCVDSKGRIRELSTGGIVLGMLPDMTFEIESIDADSFDRILLYTDGITEAQNKSDEEFGEERLKKFIQAGGKSTSRELIEKLVEAVKQFSGNAVQSDDMTVVAVQTTASDACARQERR